MPIFYKKRRNYKYTLNQEYTASINLNPAKKIDTEYIKLSESGELKIKEGYAWDGASGPALDTKRIIRGSLIHDSLYQLMREGYLDPAEYRDNADQVLREICLEDGMSRLMARMVYLAVKKFAKGAAKPDLLQAP